MWVVAGALVGLVVLMAVLGFHLGPHAHAVAVGVGAVTLAWLLLMAVDGRADSLLWLLAGADAVLSLGIAALVWRTLAAGRAGVVAHHVVPLESAEGVAVGDLDPRGVVRVQGEDWSAISVNGTVRSGTGVQVIRADGMRLEVWGEEVDQLPSPDEPGSESPWPPGTSVDPVPAVQSAVDRKEP